MPESERSYWIADWQITRDQCPDCGRPVEECSDPERRWFPFRRVCYVTMERKAALHAYEALHEAAPFHDGRFSDWAKKRGPDHPYHATEGVSIGASDRDLAPHDEFTTDEFAAPEPRDGGG